MQNLPLTGRKKQAGTLLGHMLGIPFFSLPSARIGGFSILVPHSNFFFYLLQIKGLEQLGATAVQCSTNYTIPQYCKLKTLVGRNHCCYLITIAAKELRYYQKN